MVHHRVSLVSRARRPLAALLILAFAGCGGGGAHSAGVVPRPGAPGAPATAAPTVPPVTNAPLTKTTRSGKVVLPAGSGISLGSLTVSTSLGRGAVTSSGTFSVPVFAGGPQFAALTNASGKVVMTAFLSDADPNFSVHSTALVMIFNALALYTVPAAYRVQALGEIGTLKGEAALESALAAALAGNAADPLGNAQASLRAALAAIVQNVHAAASSRQHTTPSSARRAPLGIAYEPENQVGGFVMVADFPNAVHFENLWRISAEVYVDETAPNAKSLSTSPLYQIPSVAPLDNFKSSLIETVSGTYALTQIETPSISLPPEPGAAKTIYRLVAVTPGILRSNVALTPAQIAERDRLGMTFFVQNVVIPGLYNLLFPLNSSEVDDALSEGTTDTVRDLISIINDTLTTISPLVSAGDYGGAMLAITNEVVTSNSFTTKLVDVLLPVLVKHGADPSRVIDLSKYIAAADIVIGAADFSAVTYGVTHSSSAYEFDVVSTPEKVTLSPADSTIGNQEQVTLLTVAQNAAGSTNQSLTYTYTCDCAHGTLRDDVAGHLNNFDSNSAYVYYLASTTGQGQDTITVKMTARNQTTNQKTTLGSAKATVTVQPRTLRLSPVSVTLARKHETRFVVTVPSPPPNSQISFQWSAPGVLGTLLSNGGEGNSFTDVANPGSASDTAKYVTHDTLGTDAVTVEAIATNAAGKQTSLGHVTSTVHIVDNNVKLNPAALKLAVGKNGTITASIADAPPNASLDFRWTNTARFGSLTGSLDSFGQANGAQFDDYLGSGVTSDTVRYAAGGSNGADTVTVQVSTVVNGDQTVLGSAQAAVTVSSGPVVASSFALSPSCYHFGTTAASTVYTASTTANVPTSDLVYSYEINDLEDFSLTVPDQLYQDTQGRLFSKRNTVTVKFDGLPPGDPLLGGKEFVLARLWTGQPPNFTPVKDGSGNPAEAIADVDFGDAQCP